MLWEKLQREGIPTACPGWETIPSAGKFRQSAVLVLLCGDEEDERVLLIRRPLHMNRHAGEIGFPGGRREPSDRSPFETAIREAQEEIGLDPARVRLYGMLEREFAYTSDFEIHPVLALHEPGAVSFPRFDRNEVDEILLPKVEEFLCPPRLEWGTHGNVHILFPVFELSGNCRVWGATARILWQLGRVLKRTVEETACR
ncbi:MAG: CoA pyrophosphatase [Synergistaceae bacterium]|jgi:8-oxo-dGTP pyrophosphatase MutT (NUDIX family)|nr:CoA pyrophosphatase [Synergistaceae bacterium]